MCTFCLHRFCENRVAATVNGIYIVKTKEIETPDAHFFPFYFLKFHADIMYDNCMSSA